MLQDAKLLCISFDISFSWCLFQSSNGGQSDPMSLHYITENNVSKVWLYLKIIKQIRVSFGLTDISIKQDNQYEDAIKTMGSMLSHYDLEQQFPAYGFGAKLKSNGETKWCFPLTGKSSKHCVHGMTVNLLKLIESRRNGSFFQLFSGPILVTSQVTC